MCAHEPHAAALGDADFRDVFPLKMHASTRRRLGADEQAEQRGLARSVGPDNAHGLVGADREVDAVEHLKRAETFRQRDGMEGASGRVHNETSNQPLNGISFEATGTLVSVAFSVTT